MFFVREAHYIGELTCRAEVVLRGLGQVVPFKPGVVSAFGVI